MAYFDGSSATKLPYGTLDTQDFLLWGEPRDGTAAEDRVRIVDIRQWGKDWCEWFCEVNLLSVSDVSVMYVLGCRWICEHFDFVPWIKAVYLETHLVSSCFVIRHLGSVWFRPWTWQVD